MNNCDNRKKTGAGIIRRWVVPIKIFVILEPTVEILLRGTLDPFPDQLPATFFESCNPSLRGKLFIVLPNAPNLKLQPNRTNSLSSKLPKYGSQLDKDTTGVNLAPGEKYWLTME